MPYFHFISTKLDSKRGQIKGLDDKASSGEEAKLNISNLKILALDGLDKTLLPETGDT